MVALPSARTFVARLRDVSVLVVAVFILFDRVLPEFTALAQDGGGAGDTRVALGSAFTFQGRLVDDGIPAEGAYDLKVELYDVAAGGAPVATMPVLENVAAMNGLFTVQLDFGGNAFTGEERWLAVAYRPGASAGAFTTLSPRQQLTATPYALYARSIPLAGDGTSTSAARSDHNHLNETWVGAGAGLAVTTSSDTGTPLKATNTADCGDGQWCRGAWGVANGERGLGVEGNGSYAGVLGRGGFYGVYGLNPNGVGVLGETSAGQAGVYGKHNGNGAGVFGETSSSNAAGVHGIATAGGKGVHGAVTNSDGTDSPGVLGRNSSPQLCGSYSGTASLCVGVTGEAVGRTGVGVFAEATAAGAGKAYAAIWAEGDDADYAGLFRGLVKVEGNVQATQFIPTSDGRLKENVSGVGYGIDEILRMRPVSYTLTTEDDGNVHLGLIAQELEAIVPEVVEVGVDSEQTLGVSYMELIPVLISAIQEQQAEIEALQARLSE